MFVEFATSPLNMRKFQKCRSSVTRLAYPVSRQANESLPGLRKSLPGFPNSTFRIFFACKRAKLQILKTCWVLEYALELTSVKKNRTPKIALKIHHVNDFFKIKLSPNVCMCLNRKIVMLSILTHHFIYIYIFYVIHTYVSYFIMFIFSARIEEQTEKES